MSSISTKIKIATLLGIATLVGMVLYVKADRTVEDESLDNSYTVRSSPTTNLNAVMKAHPRANEYTSSEYTSKMAPGTTQASEYLALYEGAKYDDYTYQDDNGGYRRRVAPTTHQAPVPDRGKKSIEGQRAAQSNSSAYESFGVRSAVVKNDTIVEQIEEEEEDPRLQIMEDVKQRVVGVDSYSRAVSNAEANDNAYQVQQNNKYKGYTVRSADRNKERFADTTEEGYARKSAPQSIPTKDYAEDKNSEQSYAGYAVRSAAGKDVQTVQQQNSLATTDGYARKRAPQSVSQNATSIAQYDNAKGNDKAYQPEGDSYGGYTVRSPKTKSTGSSVATTEGGYARRRAPQGFEKNAVGQNYATTTPPRSAETEYGGYAVRSPKKSTGSSLAATTEGGYARRRAPQNFGSTTSNLAQYDNANKNDGAYKATPSDETYGGYAVRTPKKNTSTTDGYTRRSAPQGNVSSQYAQGGSDNETYGGYAVRSAGKRNTQSANNSVAQRTSRPKGGVPASTGLKMYGSRGERLATNTSQKDRSVIVMPKRGRSIAGIVVQDDPGRSIIVESTTGIQSTYRYGEIDALVNL